MADAIAYNVLDIVGATRSVGFMTRLLAEPGFNGHGAAKRLASVLRTLPEAGFRFRLRWDGDEANGLAGTPASDPLEALAA